MLENVIKKLFPIRDENNQPCTFPTFASQVFFNDGTVLEGKEFGGGTSTIDPLTIYPVGSIYMSMNEESPASLFGGTWEQIKGRVLIGTGAPENNDDGTSPGDYNMALGSKGGEEKHTLTERELPVLEGSISSHSAGDNTKSSQWYTADGVFTQSETFPGYSPAPSRTGTEATSIKFIKFYAGGDQPHNNMSPYIAANIWKRVA